MHADPWDDVLHTREMSASWDLGGGADLSVFDDVSDVKPADHPSFRAAAVTSPQGFPASRQPARRPPHRVQPRTAARRSPAPRHLNRPVHRLIPRPVQPPVAPRRSPLGLAFVLLLCAATLAACYLPGPWAAPLAEWGVRAPVVELIDTFAERLVRGAFVVADGVNALEQL